jgi:O-antigen/teichoic acid export membrane protein
MTPRYGAAVLARAFAAVAAVISGLVSLRLFSVYLVPDEYGAVLVALQILGYLPFMACGFRMATNRRILASGSDREKRSLIDFGQVCTTWLGIASLFVSLVLMLLYALSPTALGANASVMFFVALAFAASLGFTRGLQVQLLIALRAQASVFVIMGMQALLYLVILWAGFRIGLGIFVFPVAGFVSSLLSFVVVIVLLRRHMPDLVFLRFRVDGDVQKRFLELIREASDCLRCDLAIFMQYTVDLILVGVLAGPEAAAVYGIVTRLFAVLRGLLQSASEAAWPIAAECRASGIAITQTVVRVNAWIYGAAAGVLWLCLVPFIRWYLGPEWTVDDTTAQFMIIRLLIVGVGTPLNFCLYGLGRFRFIRRCVERELLVGVLVGTALGYWLGMRGVAVGFLVATVFGILIPLPMGYAKEVGLRGFPLLVGMWARALTSGVASFLAVAFVPAASHVVVTLVLKGVSGMFAGVGATLLTSIIRLRGSAPLAKSASMRDRVLFFLKGV